MSIRVFRFVCLGLWSFLMTPAACSTGTETPEGASAAGEAGVDGTMPGSGGSAHAGEMHGAGAPDGGVAGAALEGGASALGGAGAGAAGAAGAETCSRVATEQPLASGIHVAPCSEITYATNPPSSGEHYPTWADYGVYDFALPRGYWVHNLEHGSVVVTYNCDDGCPEELLAAKTWLAALAPDAQCPGQTPRVLLVPDPLLDVRWAASSWGWTLRADCFDSEAFLDFYRSHAGKSPAPEATICATGTDFRPGGACGVK